MERRAFLAAGAAATLSATASSAESGAGPGKEPRLQPGDEKRERAREIIRHMFPPQNVAAMDGPVRTGRFGAEFSQLAFENAYVQLWSRPGLGLRDRSLVTLGILIALGNRDELREHLSAAVRNGVTRQELEEVIYHATGYAGFPVAAEALAVASELFNKPAA